MHPPRLDNALFMAALDEYVTGHAEAKKALIVMLNRAKMRCFQKYEKHMLDEYLLAPLKILLIGGSGTGKTHLINTIQKISCVPIVKLDATDLNPTGASGGVKSDKIYKLILEAATEAAKMYPHTYPYLEYAVDQTIVYVDEIDKLGTSFDSSGNWNKHVQSNFLTTFDNKDELAGVSFVFSGAFDSVTRQKIKKNGLGFTQVEDPPSKEILDEQILAAGIIPELLGRINTIVALDSFSKLQFIDIIHERILPKKKMDMAAYGVFDITLTDEEIEEIASNAVRSNQGVRYAQREVDKLFIDKEYKAGFDDVLYLENVDDSL